MQNAATFKYRASDVPRMRRRMDSFVPKIVAYCKFCKAVVIFTRSSQDYRCATCGTRKSPMEASRLATR